MDGTRLRERDAWLNIQGTYYPQSGYVTIILLFLREKVYHWI